MPRYDVTAPDGKVYTVNAPDGATEQEAIGYVQTNLYKPKTEPDSMGSRFAQGMKDPFSGGAQLLTKMLPDGVVNAGNELNNWLADKTGMVGRLPAGGVDQQVREQEAAYTKPEGIDWARMAGNVLSPANVALGARIPQAAGTLGKIAAGTIGGAASGALAPAVGEGAFWPEKGMQTAVGAGFGGLMPAATGAAGSVISPKASTNANVQLLKKEGVTPTIGQALGGRWNAAEEKLTSVPLLGDAISSARERARGQFNEAALNRAAAPVGSKANGIGQDAVRQVGDDISAAYNSAKNMLGTFQIDNQGSQALTALRAQASQLPPREAASFNSILNEISTDVAQNGRVTAEAYKRIDSKLGQEAAKFSGSGDAYQKTLGELLGQFKTAFTDSAKRANPSAAKAFDAADKAYANLVRVEGASKAALNSEGVFTPAQLNNAVRGADKSVRDRSTARGTALMQDLSNAGQQVLGNKVPNSGTTDRLLMALATGGGAAYVEPMLAAGLLGSAAMYTRPMQSLLSGAVTARPQSAQEIAKALRNSSPLLAPLGAQVGLSLLQ